MTTLKTTLLGSMAAVTAMLGSPAMAQSSASSECKMGAGQMQKSSVASCTRDKSQDGSLTATSEARGAGSCCAGDGEPMGTAIGTSGAFPLVAMAMITTDGPDHSEHSGSSDESTPAWTEAYTLSTCPVSGEKFGMMGDAVVKTYDGREVRFCCNGCIEDFEADKAGFFKKIDAMIIADQLRYYPLDTCVITGEPLVENGEDIAINFVYGNRLVRFCCKMCKSDFKEEPKKFIAKLDKAAADAQRKEYPLSTCMISGDEFGAMGDPVEIVLAGRLIRFCCAGCIPDLKADPAKYLAKLDAAWQAKGMFMPMNAADHAEMKGDHDMDSVNDAHEGMGGGHDMDDEESGHDDHDG